MAAQPAPQTPTPLRTQVTIEAAARQLGISPATVRRRAKRGQLKAFKRELPTGFQWFVELPIDQDEPAATQGAPAAIHDQAAEVRRLEEHVADLRRRTDDQAREIAELHRLLANQQQLLLMAPQAATQTATQTATQGVATQPGTHVASQVATQDEGTAQPELWPERRPWWQRLLWG
jgi:transposase-like protein